MKPKISLMMTFSGLPEEAIEIAASVLSQSTPGQLATAA
jgi:hypothetical protein